MLLARFFHHQGLYPTRSDRRSSNCNVIAGRSRHRAFQVGSAGTLSIYTSRLLKKTHMLRCRSIGSLQRTVSTPLVDFSRASQCKRLFPAPCEFIFKTRSSRISSGDSKASSDLSRNAAAGHRRLNLIAIHAAAEADTALHKTLFTCLFNPIHT